MSAEFKDGWEIKEIEFLQSHSFPPRRKPQKYTRPFSSHFYVVPLEGFVFCFFFLSSDPKKNRPTAFVNHFKKRYFGYSRVCLWVCLL